MGPGEKRAPRRADGEGDAMQGEGTGKRGLLTYSGWTVWVFFFWSAKRAARWLDIN